MVRAVTLLLALVFATALPAQGIDLRKLDYRKLGEIASKAGQSFRDVTPAQEAEIGSALAASLLGAAPLVDDPELQRHVGRIGSWLARQTERPELRWHFGVLDTETVNAFAAPGGYVFVTAGLLRHVSGGAELAGVLAHEIAHVLRRHHLEAMKKQVRTSLAADVASLFVKQNKELFDTFVATGMNLYARGLDREDEHEADRMGVVIAARAGYDPYGLPAFLSTLGGIGADDADLDLMFGTHPPIAERLARLDERMAGRLDHLVPGTAARRPLEQVRATGPARDRPFGSTSRSGAAGAASISEAQRLLARLGYDPGPVDGAMGPRTRRALVAFQRRSGLAPTGRLDPSVMAVLAGEVAFREGRTPRAR